MLRVTVELWPASQPGMRKVLGSLDIINTGDHPQHPTRGNYRSRFWSARKFPLKREGLVTGWPRTAKPVWSLVALILKNAGY